MKVPRSEARDAWETILLFILILGLLSAAAHAAIVMLNPVSIYVGALMLCPAMAALMTQKIKGRAISALPWRWGSWPANIKAYLLPVGYVGIAYALVWSLGLGGAPDPETITEWSTVLGLPAATPLVAMTTMIALLATVQFVKSLGTILGEELGWRGFLIWELRKVMPFGAVAVVSGVIWAVWHFPVILAYGGGDPLLQAGCFTLMIVSMSVIMAYYTFKTGSVWPAVIFHAAHNIYIQKIFTPLTIRTGNTSLWIDEYGLMVPLVVTAMALIYWRKARAENL